MKTLKVTILMMMTNGTEMPCTVTIERLDILEITNFLIVLSKANKLYKAEII